MLPPSKGHERQTPSIETGTLPDPSGLAAHAPSDRRGPRVPDRHWGTPVADRRGLQRNAGVAARVDLGGTSQPKAVDHGGTARRPGGPSRYSVPALERAVTPARPSIATSRLSSRHPFTGPVKDGPGEGDSRYCAASRQVSTVYISGPRNGQVRDRRPCEGVNAGAEGYRVEQDSTGGDIEYSSHTADRRPISHPGACLKGFGETGPERDPNRDRPRPVRASHPGLGLERQAGHWPGLHESHRRPASGQNFSRSFSRQSTEGFLLAGGRTKLGWKPAVPAVKSSRHSSRHLPSTPARVGRGESQRVPPAPHSRIGTPRAWRIFGRDAASDTAAECDPRRRPHSRCDGTPPLLAARSPSLDVGRGSARPACAADVRCPLGPSSGTSSRSGLSSRAACSPNRCTARCRDP